MGKYRRVNVSSGRPLEPLAHYSRALRCGDMVLQSGTTAIDPAGNIIGDNDIGTQVDAGRISRKGQWVKPVVRSKMSSGPASM